MVGMKPVKVPDTVTYVGVFLTFQCGYHCSYCINRHKDFRFRRSLPTTQWMHCLNRLKVDRGLMVPVTIQGGEPSRHAGFIEIVRNLKSGLYVDILTNLDFDVDRFMDAVPPGRLQRDVPYASIRASYHPGQSDLNGLLAKVFRMRSFGYDIGVFAVDHPESDLSYAESLCKQLKLDFRIKEYLGCHGGKVYGVYKYLDAIDGERKEVECRINELLIAPDGNIHRCHRDLYAGEHPLGNIMDDDLEIEFKFRRCGNYGGKSGCNPCGIKIKNNRFQKFGVCSAEIKLVDEMECLNCGWKGKESELKIVQRMGEDDAIYSPVDVCPICQDEAIEGIS